MNRRTFAWTIAGAGLAENLFSADQEEPLTSASVPGDPGAPRVSKGTKPEELPFNQPLKFDRLEAPRRAQPFALTDVRLLPSLFHDAQEANRGLLRRLPADRLLHDFRVNAGLPSSAQPLGGWEKPDCELRGHFVGHFLSGCALMYASTGDEELKTKGDLIVTELSKCQARLGGEYLSAFPLELFDRLDARKKVWAPFYTIHKIMAGLLDMHQYAQNAQALQVLKGMAAWTDKWTARLPEEHMQMVLDTEYGGMNELLYNLAAITKDDHYAAVGDRFTKKRFFNPLALRRDELRGLHTNTHIPQVIGAARRYELTSDRRFRDVAEVFWQNVAFGRSYATGGTSNNEGWLVGPNQLAEELKLGTDTNECCCAYNMLKLTRTLYTWTADPRYFDYYERVLFNHRLGTIDVHSGLTQYYLGVVPGSWRTFAAEHDSFWCCTGTGVEEFAKLNDSIYFHDADVLYVNLFTPSEVEWSAKKVRLRQTNTFPHSSETHLLIKADSPASFALNVRVPAWVVAFPRVQVNGKAVDVSAGPGSYVTIARTWQDGDTVTLQLPMNLRTEAMADDRSLKAILYGPLVLAGELTESALDATLVRNQMGPDFRKHAPNTIPSFAAANTDTNQWIQPTAKPLQFRTTGQQEDVVLKPFYEVPAGKPYSIFWKVQS